MACALAKAGAKFLVKDVREELGGGLSRFAPRLCKQDWQCSISDSGMWAAYNT